MTCSACFWSGHNVICFRKGFYLCKNKLQLILALPCFYAYNNPVGRPKTNPEKHRQNVAITLDPDLLRQAKELAASDGKSLSQVIESGLRSWIELKTLPQLLPTSTKIVFAHNVNSGIHLENILTDLSADKKIGGNDEDPYVVQAKIAAENTRNRAEARKSQLSSKKSKFRAGALLVRKKGMNFAAVTKSAPSLISNKKQENH